MKNKEVMIRELKRFQLVSVVDQRNALANHHVCGICSQGGIRISSWNEFSAWYNYVEGEIDEPQLTEQARKELEKHSESYGKYILVDDEVPSTGISNAEKKRRARRASRIYQNICRNNGINLCFFRNFSAWNDFVSGEIDELEFLQKVSVETNKLRDPREEMP